jgi:hypothetical protein
MWWTAVVKSEWELRLDYDRSPHAYVNQRLQRQNSWWWAVYSSKNVEPLMNGGIINSIKRLHLVYMTRKHTSYSFHSFTRLLNKHFEGLQKLCHYGQMSFILHRVRFWLSLLYSLVRSFLYFLSPFWYLEAAPVVAASFIFVHQSISNS